MICIWRTSLSNSPNTILHIAGWGLVKGPKEKSISHFMKSYFYGTGEEFKHKDKEDLGFR